MTEASPESPAADARGLDPNAMARLHAMGFERGWSAGDFARYLADPDMACVRSAAGFAIARITGDEAELLTLVVDPQARRRGEGRALLHRVVSALRCRGVVRLHLEVAHDNHAAIALYGAAGFSRTGYRRGYYPREGGPAADALIMALKISDALP